MNLINDPWIPVIRQDNTQELIAPWQIAEPENPVIEINAPRADFQGALYQFLIGLLQTCFAPEDEEEWLDCWKTMPEPRQLKEAFEEAAFAFDLDEPDGAAFLQDYDLADGETKPISALLIEAPGGKTIKDNLDHFIKGGKVNQLCPSCSASALFTLQTNAPSGGVGHRVGLRGGGPLTTLLIPQTSTATLWQKLWLNVFNREEKETTDKIDASIFPWLGETRVSDKNGMITTPQDVHFLQAYWGMPRRIRLTTKMEQDVCDLCGRQAEWLFTEYRTKNYGVNYDGAWVHPLTPYRFDPNKKELPLSLKGQQGGLGYRHWLGLALQDIENGDKAAEVVQFFNAERGREFGNNLASLWCFGYDMDNMKARCWYESRFPVFYLDERQKVNLMEWAVELVGAAREAVKLLRTYTKEAWFRRPKDVKGDMSQIDAQFWQATEADFYRLLEQLAKLPGDTGMAPPKIYQIWLKALRNNMFQIFETATLETIPEDLDLKRIIAAKNELSKKFHGNKAIKNLKTKAMEEEAA
ncbi:MAG: type I-E CRISPR-associated protein Cse1/CasA [Gammaproteobacteria bacterium]